MSAVRSPDRAYRAKRVRAGLGRAMVNVLTPANMPVTFDADLPTGIGTMVLDSVKYKVAFSGVTQDGQEVISFAMNQPVWGFAGVVISDISNGTDYVLKQRRIWSSKIDLFCLDKRIGSYSSNLLMSSNTATTESTVPDLIVCTGFWLIMLRFAFSA